MGRLPDFVIIGAMKCATSTLHDQLAMQSGIYMTTPKEPYFFSNDEVWQKGFNWYSSLFSGAAETDLCGESSTHYTKLPTYPKTVERMQAHIPNAKLIYVLRHPIERLVSHYIHDWTENKIRVPIDDAIHSYPDLIDYSRYAMQLRPFLDTYGPKKILIVFFERLTSSPQQEFERICRFLGYEGNPQWQFQHATNVSEKRMRNSAIRDAIVWNPIVTKLRRTLIPKSIRESIKAKWQMKGRPEISDANQQRLARIFDEDLAVLSAYIGVPLTCENFKHQTRNSALNGR
jgi:hypothetical protein